MTDQNILFSSDVCNKLLGLQSKLALATLGINSFFEDQSSEGTKALSGAALTVEEVAAELEELLHSGAQVEA
ncbi:MAG: hypothetical protein IKN64_02910 [Desulfovibrio sp.]|nr:hypothetical protein [Desulfovibrio sp.]